MPQNVQTLSRRLRSLIAFPRWLGCFPCFVELWEHLCDLLSLPRLYDTLKTRVLQLLRFITSRAVSRIE